ncbi:MAG: hypothetical protein HBSAPP03_12980 [Phycisphaerae bacterium]|nr:MAG: hypothetical protein HBSAPP03_12980 [Phycisphaerae bacterium]
MVAPAPPQARRARCIIWHPPNAPPRPELAAALNRPAFRVFRADNPHLAFAYLCSWSAEVRPAPGESTILLLVEPDTLPHIATFLEIREQFEHEAALWIYERAATPILRMATSADLARWRASPPVNHDPAPRQATIASPPALRLAGDGSLPPERSAPPADHDTPSPVPDVKPRGNGSSQTAGSAPDADAPPPEPVRPSRAPLSSLLSDEELAMLLALDPGKRTT